MEASCTLDRFQVFITQIALELTSVDTKILKSLFRGILPARVVDAIDIKERLPSLDLVAKLQEYCVVSQNNLALFKEALDTSGRPDLVPKIEEFEKTVTELRDASLLQMAILPAPNTVFLRLLLSDPNRSEELTQKTNSLRESICKKMKLDLKVVAFVTKEEASIQDCVFIVYQFPNEEPKIMQLNSEALNRAEWLVSLGVLQLQIGDMASINIRENLQDIKPVPRRQTSVLAVNSNFAVHEDDTLDVILGIELLSFNGEHVNTQLLAQCQSALKAISGNGMSDEGGFDMKHGVVTYGNHFNTTQPMAFASESLSKDLDVMKNEKEGLDGEGCSGIADALKKVLEFEDVRKEASKVCIMLTFLNQKSCDPEHYKCSHDNDIIKHCNALAKSGITLYIIGIHTAQSLSNRENHFLSGVARIGGGLYLEVDDLSYLDKIITCIIKHDISIEKHGKYTCEALIDEINRKFGIVNINHLSRCLKQILNKNAIGVDGFRLNGETFMPPISQISERVAMADDLEDAINAVQAMSKQFKASDIRERSQANLRQCSVRNRLGLAAENVSGVSLETAKGDHSKIESNFLVDNLSRKDGNDVCFVENETVDLEVASRIVKRQLHRMEYHKIDEDQDMEY